MKNFAVMALFALVLVIVSCNDGMSSNSRGGSESGMNNRGQRTRRTVIDAGKYKEMTDKKINANSIIKMDVLELCFENYRLENGNSEIKFDRTEGTVTLTSDDAFYKGLKGQQMYAKYKFDVAAANDDCLYLRLKNKEGARLIIGSDMFSNNEVPDLVVSLPLYGFGTNRVAVSPVMNGYIGMPSGTYWKKQ
jgi:hypothetical protein